MRMNNNHSCVRVTFFLRVIETKIDIFNQVVLLFQNGITAISVAEESGKADVSSFIKEYLEV